MKYLKLTILGMIMMYLLQGSKVGDTLNHEEELRSD